MLLRLDTVEEVGRFAVLRHKAPQFSRLCLIYARNAYGKSTVSAILRSSSENQPNYIHARRRLDATKETRIQLTWNPGTTVTFSSGVWNHCPGRIYVFDQEFVHLNLHVGENVTRDNKRSLLPVVLGMEGVKLAQEINGLDREQRELDMLMKKQAALIQAACPAVSPDRMTQFCAREVPEDIAKKVATAARDVELARHSVAVKQKPDPKVIPLQSIDHYRELASRTITSVSADAAKRVQSHIQTHALEPHGDRWLRYGVERLQGGTCPFCARPLSEVGDLVTAYQTYFSDAFAKLLSDRDEALASVKEVAVDDYLTGLAAANDADFSFWKTVCDLPDTVLLTADDRTRIASGLRALSSRLELKVSNPLGIVTFGDDASTIEAAFALVADYNARIGRVTSAIAAARSIVVTADLSAAQTVHQQWLALEAKNSDPVKAAAAEYTAADTRRKEIEVDKKAAQKALTTYSAKTMAARQVEINNLLSDFGANFVIVDAKANFAGREPNAEFALAIGAKKVKVGDKSLTEPSFATVLSAGDKATLALVFFLVQARADPNVKDAVVVFDDPFNSQDMCRQFETTSQIRSLASLACQTIVLSHDPRFLHMIEKDADQDKTKTFQLLCSEKGVGDISLWSSAEELKEPYVRQAEMIREFAGHGVLLKDVTHVLILQSIRPFLESYIKARFPGRFVDKDMLGGMIEVINDAGHDDPMYSSVEELKALNEYTRPNMHGGGQMPDPVALRAQCRKVIRIIGKY